MSELVPFAVEHFDAIEWQAPQAPGQAYYRREWAEEIAEEWGLPTIIHKPRVRSWGAPGGLKDRNLAIARDSDLVLCIVVRDYHEGYRGMRFDGCYHCGKRVPRHVKSGGCWTAWRCEGRMWQIITEKRAEEVKP